ncbi:MAG: hypothetical protein IKW81_06925 [Pseudobutyrivibrio sp.]|nr:hypothetical protein [Pseudobutyrivibrio sp.]
MEEEKIRIKYKLSYRIQMVGLSVIAWIVFAFIMVSEQSTGRLYCITDNIWRLLYTLFILGVVLLISCGAIGSIYDCVMIEGRIITIRSLFNKTISGDSHVIDSYFIKKDNKEKNKETSIELKYGDNEVSFGIEDLTNNYNELLGYLKNYCKEVRNTNSTKVDKTDNPEEDYIEKYGLKKPSKLVRRYVAISRIALEVILLSYIFCIQFIVEDYLHVLFWMTIVIYTWLIVRLIFWQDSILAAWLSEDKNDSKRKSKLQKFLRYFIVTPVIGALFLYMRASTAYDKFHIYQMGNMNNAIIIYSLGIWFLVVLMKNIFCGHNCIPFKVNLIRQLVILFLIFLMSGHVIYAVSLLYKPECHIEKAQIIDTSEIHHRRGGYSYYVNVRYKDGNTDEYNVLDITYDNLFAGDEVEIEYYDTFLGSKYRHLPEINEH